MNLIAKKIFSTPVAVRIIDFSKRSSAPGLGGLPIYEVFKFFKDALTKGALSTRASSVAYNFFMAIFPSTIFLFTLIPYIPIDNFQAELFNLLKEILPRTAFQAAQSTILDILNQPRSGLLSLGFILALFFSTNGMLSMIKAFNASFYSIETRSATTIRLVATSLVLIVTVIIVIAIALIIFSDFLIDSLKTRGYITDSFTYILLQAGRWTITVALLFFIYSFLFYFGPSRRMEYRFISAGSTVSTVLSLITSAGFAFYVNNFGQYNKLYGSIGTLMVIMLWLYLNCLILLLGFELNASIINARKALFTSEE